MKNTQNIKLFEPTLVNIAIRQSFIKLNPAVMIKNPVMFCVEVESSRLEKKLVSGLANVTVGDALVSVTVCEPPAAKAMAEPA